MRRVIIPSHLPHSLAKSAVNRVFPNLFTFLYYISELTPVAVRCCGTFQKSGPVWSFSTPNPLSPQMKCVEIWRYFKICNRISMSRKPLPKRRQHFLKYGFNHFFQKAYNFVHFLSYDFVQISQDVGQMEFGPNTY